MFWVLSLIPLAGFAEQEWTPFGSEEEINSPRYEQCKKEISFETTGPVQVECSYPIFFGKGVLIEHVNQELKIEAENRFGKFVNEERSSDEVWEEECL